MTLLRSPQDVQDHICPWRVMPINIQQPTSPLRTLTTRNTGVDVSTTGVKQTYTVPAATASRLISATMLVTAGVAPTITVVWTTGATPTVLATQSGNFTLPFKQWGIATDTFTFEVTVAGAGGVATLTLVTEEYGV